MFNCDETVLFCRAMPDANSAIIAAKKEGSRTVEGVFIIPTRNK